MLQKLRHFFRPREPEPWASIPPEERVYAIGDIHGRHDLFTRLLTAIDDDDAERPAARTTLILLGDLIDRGPDSAAVIEDALELCRHCNARILSGNHEEMFLLSFYNLDVFRNFLRVGGRETVLSYGVDADAFARADLEEAQAMMRDAVPAAHREFIHGFEKMIRIGDYVFVHAGVRPDTALDEQTGRDCRWIREPFLSHAGDLGGMVVHGHTVTPEAELRRNRIGIDTGAYMSGRLTALGLEGTARWFIQASDESGAIETVTSESGTAERGVRAA